jgi:hypothetical protein
MSMLLQYTPYEVTIKVASFPIDAYPLLVCLSVHQDRIDIVSVIQGSMTTDEILADLIESRKKFDRRTELPHSTMSHINRVSNESQSISAHTIKPITEWSPIVEKITRDFKNSNMQINRIDQVDNETRLMQYLEQKKIIDARLGHDNSEKFLFHGCPRSAAEEIIKRGFDHNLIGMHGNTSELESNNTLLNYFRNSMWLRILFFI